MKRFFIALTTALLAAAFIAGCDADRRGAKIAPQTELHPQDDSGYDRDGRGDYNSEASGYSDYDESGNMADDFNLVTVYFGYDRFELTPEALDIMSGNAERMWNHPRTVVLIEGHCDERGTEEYNLALGEKRAREVKDYLVKYGIDTGRLSIISYGESAPDEFGHSEKSWAQNRRASFAILSK
jgi:peptidoglycan-associated lipoprotein